MSEAGDKSEKNGPTSTLADNLFNQALQHNATEHLNNASRDLARGAADQASEHLKRALGQTEALFANVIFPGLTEEESRELRKLQQKKYKADKNGIVSIRPLGDYQEQRIKELEERTSSHGG